MEVLVWVMASAVICLTLSAARLSRLERMLSNKYIFDNIRDTTEGNITLVRKIDELSAFYTHYLKDATRCPECEHLAVGASFCEDTAYICPQCGEKFIWKLRDGKYVLDTNIEG